MSTALTIVGAFVRRYEYQLASLYVIFIVNSLLNVDWVHADICLSIGRCSVLIKGNFINEEESFQLINKSGQGRPERLWDSSILAL
tara:strand:+ start:3073 stop:3330 length:258 start_codon:yes stop_codon:yes gene_type:complete